MLRLEIINNHTNLGLESMYQEVCGKRALQLTRCIEPGPDMKIAHLNSKPLCAMMAAYSKHGALFSVSPLEFCGMFWDFFFRGKVRQVNCGCHVLYSLIQTNISF
jgi:hypothetical protein